MPGLPYVKNREPSSSSRTASPCLILFQGKTNIGNDRALHHYAGALNALPVLKHYLAHHYCHRPGRPLVASAAQQQGGRPSTNDEAAAAAGRMGSRRGLLSADDSLHLLRLGMAGMMGSLTNIQPRGGPSMGFHGDPSLLRPDG